MLVVMLLLELLYFHDSEIFQVCYNILQTCFLIDVEFAYHVNELNSAVHQNALWVVFSIVLTSLSNYKVSILSFFWLNMSVWRSEGDNPTAEAVAL